MRVGQGKEVDATSAESYLKYVASQRSNPYLSPESAYRYVFLQRYNSFMKNTRWLIVKEMCHVTQNLSWVRS